MAVGVGGGHAEPVFHAAFQSGHFAGLFETDVQVFPAGRRGRVGGRFDVKGAAAHGSFPTQAHGAFKVRDDGAQVAGRVRSAHRLFLFHDLQSRREHRRRIAGGQDGDLQPGVVRAIARGAHLRLALVQRRLQHRLGRFHFRTRGGRFIRAFGHGLLDEGGAMFFRQPGDAVGNSSADGNFFEHRTVGEVKLEVFHPRSGG